MNGRRGAELAGVTLAYFAVAKLGLSFSAGHDIVSAVWPPSGVAVAAVVIFGYRVWPAIAVGALVANATGDSPLGAAAGIATGNAVAALVAAYLLRRADFEPALRRVRDVVALALLAAGASTAVNATVGVFSLWAAGLADHGLWAVWRVWWLGDLTGVLLVAPPLLLAAGGRGASLPRARIAEASVLVAALIGVSLIVLDHDVTLAYPVFPLIVFAAMRFRQPGAVIAALTVSILGVYYTANGNGPFIGGSEADELLQAQLFVALAAATGLLVAAMRTEWERAEGALIRLGESESRLEHLALHDPLTNLPNRALFLDRLEHALAASRRPQLQLGVFFCDIDDFKLVNDTLGHEAGDELLVALPPRLREALRPTDTIARFGGDEFVVLCEDLASETDAVRVAERIAAAFSRPVQLGGREHYTSVSVGVVFVSPGKATAGDVLRDADAAMYRAKAAGKGRFALFDDRMRTRLVRRLQIEADLRQAIRDGQLRMLYQPVVSLAGGEIAFVEALLRWQHPRLGLLGPDQFIGVAEESGLIVEIGAWTVEEACSTAANWKRRDGRRPLPVSINLSARQVVDTDVADLVATALERNSLEPDLVALEITENVLLGQGDPSLENLRRLKRIGVRLVLDDFGTGYSSLSHLKRFPIDSLKIDRDFVSGLGRHDDDTAIVAAILSMAEALEIAAVAEGVETEEQLAWLREHSCGLAQGYLLGRPQGPDELFAREPDHSHL